MVFDLSKLPKFFSLKILCYVRIQYFLAVIVTVQFLLDGRYTYIDNFYIFFKTKNITIIAFTLC